MPWTNVRTALDLLPGRPDRPWLHGWSTNRNSRAICAQRGVLCHGRADQLLLPAHAAPGALGAPTIRSAACSGLGLRIHPEHRRSDPSQGHAHRGLADDGARLRFFGLDDLLWLPAQRPGRRLDRRCASVAAGVPTRAPNSTSWRHCVPGLAERWEQDPADNKTWIFHLRRGVKFHDGTEFQCRCRDLEP